MIRVALLPVIHREDIQFDVGSKPQQRLVFQIYSYAFVRCDEGERHVGNPH
jgi:hypothetical protein